MAVFSYDIETKGLVNILKLGGRLTDPFTVKTILSKLQESTKGINPLLLAIDLHALEYMNSSGLQLLLSLLRQSRLQNGEVVIFAIPDRIKQLLVLTKLEHIFKVCDTLDNAIAKLEAVG